MTHPRIFLDSLPEPGEARTIDESRSHYLKNVLRLKEGRKSSSATARAPSARPSFLSPPAARPH